MAAKLVMQALPGFAEVTVVGLHVELKNPPPCVLESRRVVEAKPKARSNFRHVLVSKSIS
jgi:hypothetical protein